MVPCARTAPPTASQAARVQCYIPVGSAGMGHKQPWHKRVEQPDLPCLVRWPTVRGSFQRQRGHGGESGAQSTLISRAARWHGRFPRRLGEFARFRSISRTCTQDGTCSGCTGMLKCAAGLSLPRRGGQFCGCTRPLPACNPAGAHRPLCPLLLDCITAAV